ncbi:MAG TPA: hypothetical protein VGG27_03815 [Magnetospirillaceae bacterium]|jgi:hypothetical protein
MPSGIRLSSASAGIKSVLGSALGASVSGLIALQFAPIRSYWILVGVVFLLLALILVRDIVLTVRNMNRSHQYQDVALQTLSAAPTIDGGVTDFQPTFVHRISQPWPFAVALDTPRGLVRLVDQTGERIVPAVKLIAAEVQNRQDVTIEGKVSGRPYVGATFPGGATGGWTFGAKTKSKVIYKDNAVLNLVWEGANHAPIRLQIPFGSRVNLANDWLLAIRSARARLGSSTGSQVIDAPTPAKVIAG